LQAKDDLAKSNDDARTVRKLKRLRNADYFARCMWLLSVAALMGIVVLAYLDARFVQTADKVQGLIWLFRDNDPFLQQPSSGSNRFVTLAMLCWVGAIGVLGIIFGLFIGPPAHRRLRSWLALTALIAGWLTLWTNWPEIAWLGQQHRLRAELARFEAMATTLRDDFPRQDGERPLLGPYMAYPIGRPTILLLLTPTESPHSGIHVAAIERHPDGGLCFQLSAAETGAWLEWHPPGRSPQSFTGGLLTDYRLQRYSQIAPEWHLVRYHEPQVMKPMSN
jgi:hypothetical protein